MEKLMEGSWVNSFDKIPETSAGAGDGIPSGTLTITNSLEEMKSVWFTVYSDGTEQKREGSFTVYVSDKKDLDGRKRSIAVFQFIIVNGVETKAIVEEYYVIFKKDENSGEFCMFLQETSLNSEDYNKFEKKEVL